MKKAFWFCWLAAAMFFGQSPVTQAKVNRIYLQSNDRDIKAIVIAENAAGAAAYAAEELQRYLQQVTSVRLPICKDTDKDIPRPAILVGPGKLTKDLGLDAGKLHPEGFFLKTTPDYLVIAGNDHPLWTKDILEEKPEEEVVSQRDYGELFREAGTRIGTLFGVYTFLQEFAGVGWYFSGPLGEVVPPGRDIVIPDLDRVEKPEFEIRILGPSESRDRKEVRRFQKRSLNGCSRYLYFNHSLEAWGRYYGKEHPEYFALVNGQRQNDWGWTAEDPGGENSDFRWVGKNFAGKARDFCWANPAMIERQCQEMRLFFKGDTKHNYCWLHADKLAYPIGANDGKMKPCECEYCRRWNDPGRGYRGSLADVYAYHLSEVAKAAQKEFPGKLIAGLAYGPRVLPPVKIGLPTNVIIGLAFNSPMVSIVHPASRRAYDELVNAWCKVAVIHEMWEYVDAYRDIPNIPLVYPHAVGEEIISRKGKTRGFYFSSLEPNAYSEPERYVASQLMWNIDQDVDSLLDRYFTGLYGPAAKPVKEIYRHLENFWTEEILAFSPPIDPAEGLTNAPNWKVYPKLGRIWKKVFTPEQLVKLFPLLENARSLAGGNQAVLLRLARLENEIKMSFGESCRANNFGLAKAKEKAQAQPAPACPALEPAPVIDGTLSDPAWQKALSARMENILVGAAKPAHETKLWVGRDAENLYVAVECAEPLMARLFAEKVGEKHRQNTVFCNDDLEIFIDAKNSQIGYYQLGVDAAGQTAAFYYQEGRQQPVTVKGVKVAVQRKENAWIAEIKIPFAELGGAPAPGSRWGINIVRNRQAKDSSPQELSGWFPNMTGEFHVPEHFGKMAF